MEMGDNTDGAPKTQEPKTQEPKTDPEPEEELYRIGESFESGKLGVKIVEVEEQTEFINDNMFIDDVVTEGKFIAVTATLTNNDDKARTFSNSQFQLIDEEGREFDTFSSAGLMIALGDNYLFLESCNPGMSRTGVFVFEVPEDVDSYSLKVRGGIAGVAKKSATVKLK